VNDGADVLGPEHPAEIVGVLVVHLSIASVGHEAGADLQIDGSRDQLVDVLLVEDEGGHDSLPLLRGSGLMPLHQPLPVRRGPGSGGKGGRQAGTRATRSRRHCGEHGEDPPLAGRGAEPFAPFRSTWTSESGYARRPAHCHVNLGLTQRVPTGLMFWWLG